MASVRALIADDIETTLQTITVANGYNIALQKVIKHKIIPDEKLDPLWRQALVQFRYAGQTNARDSHHTLATCRYQCQVSMTNNTADNFLMFLDDIEAALDKDSSRGGLDGAGYSVYDTYVQSINMSGSDELDEILDSGDHKELVAILIIIVEYTYVADLLSGS